MTAEEKKELVKYLRHGDKRLICEMAGVHPTVMYAWLSGRLKNSVIEPYVIEVSNKRKEEILEKFGDEQDTPLLGSIVEPPAWYRKLLLEKENLELELESSKKEISNYLKVLSGKNRLFRSFSFKLQQFTKEEKLTKEQVERLLDFADELTRNDSFLKNYEKYASMFQQINAELEKSIVNLTIGFSEYEKRVMSFLKLNFSDEEIATLLSVKIRDVTKCKVRLKSNLNLHPKAKISDFINAL